MQESADDACANQYYLISSMQLGTDPIVTNSHSLHVTKSVM